jgi:hypothetical protein
VTHVVNLDMATRQHGIWWFFQHVHVGIYMDLSWFIHKWRLIVGSEWAKFDEVGL